MEDETELVLHVWPGRWHLPTFTPTCLASVLYLQLALPGKFVLEECTNPDLSPDGQLPFLTHGFVCVASFLSIVKYIEGLHKRTGTAEDIEERDGNIEDEAANEHASSNPVRRAQQTAWMAYVSASLGDLVACSFFTLRHNYYESTRPALSELFPAPQRYYVPDRLRETYKPRLEAAGLWTVHAEEAEEEKRQKRGVASNSAVHEAFGKEKVLDKARTALDLLSRLLGDKPFFLDSLEPSILDVLVAAHVLLLTTPPLPNDLLRSLIIESYPSLLAHARSLQKRTLPPQASHAPAASLSSSFDLVEAQTRPVEEHVPLHVRSASPASFSQVVSSLALPFFWQTASATHGPKAKSKEDKEFDRMRWAWFGLAALGIAGWVWTVGHKIVLSNVDSPEDEDAFVEAGEGIDEEEAEEDENEEEGE